MPQKMHVKQVGLLMRRAAVAKWRLQRPKIGLILGTVLGLLATAAAGVGAVRKGARRRSTEAAQQDSEDQYRTLLNEVHDYAILMLDLKGRVVTWNSSAERIKGYDAEQIIGENFSCFFPHDDIKRGRPEE